MTQQPIGGSSTGQVNGAAVRYHRRGGGRPIVLLHPLRMQLEYFDPLCAELGDAGVELIAVDLPGHGHSSAPTADRITSRLHGLRARRLPSLSGQLLEEVRERPGVGPGGAP